MSNGDTPGCCFWDVCCGGEKKRRSLIAFLMHTDGVTHQQAENQADRMLAVTGFAPKEFEATVHVITAAARAHPYEG